MNVFNDPIIALALRIALIALFGFSVLHKLSAFGVYAQTVTDYRLLPERLSKLASVIMFGVELTIIAALLSLEPGWPFLLAAAVLTVYALAIGINLARGRRQIDCGCGGPPGQTISLALVIRNVFLAAAAALCATLTATRALSLVDVLVALAAAIVAALLYSTCNQLLLNQPRLKSLS